MSGYPIVLQAPGLMAAVIGGGTVATRKVRALLEAGATVRVIAPSVDAGIRDMSTGDARLSIAERVYAPEDLADATLVIAATDSRATNAAVARDGMALRKLVMVADAPEEGNCSAPAVHRAGDLLISVATGGVPGAAVRIRDAIAARFDDRYAAALARLRDVRLAARESGTPEERRERLAGLTGPDFCSAVESGSFTERLAAWR